MNSYCDRTDCFGNNNAYCVILTDTELKRECPFFKTRLQKYADEVRIMEKLDAEWATDIIKTYYGGMECFERKLEDLRIKIELLKEI